MADAGRVFRSGTHPGYLVHGIITDSRPCFHFRNKKVRALPMDSESTHQRRSDRLQRKWEDDTLNAFNSIIVDSRDDRRGKCHLEDLETSGYLSSGTDIATEWTN